VPKIFSKTGLGKKPLSAGIILFMVWQNKFEAQNPKFETILKSPKFQFQKHLPDHVIPVRTNMTGRQAGKNLSPQNIFCFEHLKFGFLICLPC